MRCVEIRSSRYLNNVVEQDHRRIKQRVRAMLGFKRLETAAITITGIELAEKFGNSSSRSGIYQVGLYLFPAYGLLSSRHNLQTLFSIPSATHSEKVCTRTKIVNSMFFLR